MKADEASEKRQMYRYHTDSREIRLYSFVCLLENYDGSRGGKSD